MAYFDRQKHRHGHGPWAMPGKVNEAGLFNAAAPRLGEFGGQSIGLEADSPLITFAGAGGGKLRDVLGYVTCLYTGRMVWLDLRGELTRIARRAQEAMGKQHWCVNPLGLHDEPMHRPAVFAMLKPDSPRLAADCRLFAAMLRALSGSGEAQFFEMKARSWIAVQLQHQVLTYGSVTPPRLFQVFTRIETSEDAWATQIAEMLASPVDEIRRTAAEMQYKRENAEKEYSAIMAEITGALDFLADPALADCLGGDPDFALSAICDPDKPCNISIIVPAEYTTVWAPFLRLVIGGAMLEKFRYFGSPRVLFLVDEAAQLGRFEMLLTAYSYGRGAGIRTWSFWQDVTQPDRVYERGTTQSLIASSQVRQFFAVRDYQTAKLVSDMLGNETLEYDEPLQQAAARAAQRAAVHDLLNGDDPLKAAFESVRQGRASRHRHKQPRPLLTPAEVMGMPENRQILFVSGLDCPPIFAERKPYWAAPEMQGKFDPNPFHQKRER